MYDILHNDENVFFGQAQALGEGRGAFAVKSIQVGVPAIKQI